MNQSEIQVGSTYTNGKGRDRRVELINRPSKGFGWEVIYRTVGGPLPLGVIQTMLRQSFASWAKAEVKEEADNGG